MPYPSYPLATLPQFMEHAQHAAGLIISRTLLDHKDQAANDAVTIISYAASFVGQGAPVVFGDARSEGFTDEEGTLNYEACAKALDEAVEYASGPHADVAAVAGGYDWGRLLRLAMLILEFLSKQS